MSELEKTLLKLKVVNKKNVFLYSSQARDKKIKIYKDKNTNVIYIKSKLKKNYYKKKLFSEDIAFLKKLNLKKLDKINLIDVKRRVKVIKKNNNSNLLDIGCGNGNFLQFSKNHFKELSGVEPNLFQFLSLSKYFKMYSDINTVNEKYSVITLFHVLEHVEDQIGFLKNIKDKLKKNGVLYIEVPHANDIMLQFEPYRKFILWSEHRVLHTKNSIAKLLSYVGFKIFSIDFVQRYDANNHLGWIMSSKPGGHENLTIVKKSYNIKYKNGICKKGISDTLFIRVQNS